MATLINGNGNLAIYAQQDADWYAALMGGQTVITAVGNQFAYELLASNTIGVKDGVIVTKEGRRIQLDANAIDSFDIPTGAQGTTNYYIIGYHLVTGNQSEQTCETFVQLMENGTDTIPEGSFRDGDDEVFVSLYRVEQDDLTIGTITLLLPQLSGSFQSQITELNNDLTEFTTSNETLLATITSFNTTNDVVINMSGYNEILFDIISNQSQSGYSMHNMYRYKPSDIEKVRADTSHKFNNIAPVLNMIGQFNDNAFTQLRVYCMSAPNTFRFSSNTHGDYSLESIKIYGSK